MGTSAGPSLQGIGRGGDSNLVLEMDAHDAKSYPGEPTTNLFPQPSLASASVGTTWSGNGGTWGTSTATVESVIGPDGKYIKAVSNQHTASGGGDAHIWFFYNYLSGMGSAQRDLTLTNGTAYTCSWWWKANESRTTIDNNIYFVGVANVSTGGSNIVTTEWTRVSVSFTFGGTTGTYNPGHYFYNVGDSTAVGFKVWYAMLQIEEKTYATPAVRSQLSGFGQQGYNARPASTNLMIHGDVGTGQTFSDSSPSKHTITANGNTTHSSAQSKFSGGSVYFDGTGDYLSVPQHADWAFGTGSFTVDCWVYKIATVAWETFMDSYSYAVNGFICGLNDTDSTIAFYSENGTGWNYAGGTALALNTWYHLAWVRDGNNFRMFVNGTQQGSTFTFSSSDNYTEGTLLVGSRNGAQYINGYMDEVRVTKGTALWTSAFTPPTRRNLSAPVVDRSSHDNGGNFATKDMTDVSTYRVGEVIRPIGSAVWDFDNTDDVITLGPSSGLGITDTVSVFAWIKLDSTSGWSGIFGTYDGGGFIHFQLNSGGMNVYLYGPNIAYGAIDSESYLSAGEWTHIGFTYNSTVLTVYINGQSMPTKPTTSSTANISSVTEVSMGRVYASSRMLNGQIGNVQVYNTTLTDQQVKENFKQQSNRFNVPNWSNRDIVQSGLEMWLDAGISESYPGSGTTWSDISGNGYNGTITGATYSGEGHGSLDFNGTTDKVDVSTSTWGAGSFCISMWFKGALPVNYQMLFGGSGYGGGGGIGHYLYSTTISTWITHGSGTAQLYVGSTLSADTWYNLVFQRDYGVAFNWYLNGQNIHNYSSNYLTTDLSSPNSTIAKHYNSTAYNFDGNIATTDIYTRALSASEIEQNFIVQRQRFGV